MHWAHSTEPVCDPCTHQLTPVDCNSLFPLSKGTGSSVKELWCTSTPLTPLWMVRTRFERSCGEAVTSSLRDRNTIIRHVQPSGAVHDGFFRPAEKPRAFGEPAACNTENVDFVMCCEPRIHAYMHACHSLGLQRGSNIHACIYQHMYARPPKLHHHISRLSTMVAPSIIY